MTIEAMASQGGLADINQRPQDSNSEKLLTDIKTLISDTESLLKTTAELSLEGYAAARASIEEKLIEARERLKRAKVVVAEKTKQGAEATSEYVRAHPIKAVSLGLVSGLVLGFTLSNMKH